MWFSLLFMFTWFSVCQIKAQDHFNVADILGNDTNCIAKSIQLYEDEILPIEANCSWLNDTHVSRDNFDILIKDLKIAKLVNITDRPNSSSTGDYIFIKGVFLGRTEAILHYKGYQLIQPAYKDMLIQISVIRKERIVDHLFVAVVTLLMMLAYVGMGCAVDLGAVKEVLKKPVAPIIGFMSQYVIMPLAAFAVVKSLGLTGGIALGFFASGCAPGGGASNMYTYLLGGDSSLSVTMTLVSTVASLAMFPLWLHSLGRLVYNTHGSQLRVPFTNIFTTLAVMIIPLAIGAIIKIKKALWAERIQKIMRPFFAIIILLLITLGTWSNLYLFRLISPGLILGACVLSYSGFLLGGLLAFACRLKWSRVVAVAIETGVQNTGLPILLLKFSLPQPDADLSVVSPVAVAMLMPIPLWLTIAFLEIRKKCKGSSPVLVTSESEVKVLKVQEANGGTEHFLEEDGIDEGLDANINKAHFEGYDLGKGDEKTFDASEGEKVNLPNGSGDARYENDRF